MPDVEAELDRIGHELRERDIVLVRTGRDAFVEEPGYMALGPGVTVDATRWLYERGVRVMGIDAWGWDGPLHLQAQAALESNESGVFWAAHQADLPYSQIERLVNLGELPPTGFQVACFPLRIVGASAAPARVVAFLRGLRPPPPAATDPATPDPAAPAPVPAHRADSPRPCACRDAGPPPGRT